MKKFFLKIIFILIFMSGISYSQENFLGKIFKDIEITPSFNYITSASIQLNPYSSNPVESNTVIDLNGGTGFGITLKKGIYKDYLYLGLSSEYVKIIDDNQVQYLFTYDDFKLAKATETIWMVPLEISLYFNVPSFTEDLNIFLGGGAGIYFGDRIRKFYNLETKTNSSRQILNIHTMFGLQYCLSDNFFAAFEVKFRQGEFEVNSSFPTGAVYINNEYYFFEQNLNSKIFFDGLKLSFGISYKFN
ncbi:MAG: hypothetical protein FJ216_02180 [Ignavibacteria bacterium]|nr:hypothetical protein [Ignavibacteria bacterium]